MAKAKSTAHRLEALKLASKGLTTREVATALQKKHPGESFSEAWVRKVAASPAPVEVPTPVETKPAAPAKTAKVSAAPPSDVYEHTRLQLASAIERAELATADGNHTAAQRFSKQIVDYTLLLARLDKDRKVGDDVVVVPRSEFKAAEQTARDVLGALRADIARSGGLVCNHCGRDIRLALAKGE
jgi:hypothetical protein